MVTVELRRAGQPPRTMEITERAAAFPWLNTMDLLVAADDGTAQTVTHHYERVATGVYEWRSADVDRSPASAP